MSPLNVGNEVERENAEDELRLVLIGRTGSGKSASGNTILGRRTFLSKPTFSSVTQVCELGISKIPEDEQDRNGCRRKNVLVVDTPGFGDTRSDPDQVHTEISKCVVLSAPGPHAFLLVIQLNRYTEDEDKAAREMLQIFGESALQHHTVLVFTHGDDLEEAGGDMESFLGQDAPEALRALVEVCGGRYHVLNNKQPENRNQVRELLRKVEKMVEENGGQCYTSAMFQEAERAIQEEQERLMREAMEREMMIARRRKKNAQGAEEVHKEETYKSSADGWGPKEWGREKSKSSFWFRIKAMHSPEVLQRIKVLVVAAAVGLAVGAACGAVVPLAFVAGATLIGTSVGLTAGIVGYSALVGAGIGGVAGVANGMQMEDEAAEPSEVALETLKQVGKLGAAAAGGAFVAGAGLGAVGIITATGAATTGQDLAGVMGTRLATAVALAGGIAVKVIKEKVPTANGCAERKSYEMFWNK